MYLLDTNIVSELRRRKPHGVVVEWLKGVAAHHLHLSAVTIGELRLGVERTREQDAAKAADIEAWLERLAGSFNIIAMDALVFRCWGRLMHRTSDTLVEDAMIAATAEVHDLTVVTRNVRDFEIFAAKIFNPFDPR